MSRNKTAGAAPAGLKPKSRFWTLVIDVLYDIVGSALYSSGVHVFTASNNIAPGGVTGVATIINHFSGFPIGTLSLIINIPLLILAFSLWGKRLTLKTIKSVVILSVVMDLIELFVPTYDGNPLLAALFGGVCMGAGLALVFIRGSTTGGTDIVGRLLQKFFPAIQTGRAILVIDFMVLLASAVAYVELLQQGKLIASLNFNPIEAYTAVAVIFFICLWPLVQLSYLLERRLRRDE